MIGTTVVALVASLLAAPLIIDDIPTEKVVVELIAVNGSGCTAGTAAIAVAEDNTAFTATYSNYLAMVGVGSRPTDTRKNCQLNLLVHAPAGFTYTVTQADHRGYGHLEEGATAAQRWNLYYAGMSQTQYHSHPFKGPLDNDWQTTDTMDDPSFPWQPCGAIRYLSLSTELRVTGGTSDLKKTTSFMAMDHAGSSGTYHLAWKRC
jgi:hypothetical protein